MQTNTQEVADKSRGTRLEARISIEQKTVLQQAAALSGRSGLPQTAGVGIASASHAVSH